MDLTKPEYSYMFGFLQMDGHLRSQSRNRGCLSLELGQVDKGILYKFEELIDASCKISFRTRTTNFKADATFFV